MIRLPMLTSFALLSALTMGFFGSSVNGQQPAQSIALIDFKQMSRQHANSDLRSASRGGVPGNKLGIKISHHLTGQFRFNSNWKIIDMNDREVGDYGIDQPNRNIFR